MAAEGIQELKMNEVFTAFAGGAEMDGRAFVKCLKDAKLMDKSFNTVDADLIFAKNKSKGHRKIDFTEFLRCLAGVAERKELEQHEIMASICDTAGPRYRSNGEPYDGFAGPERFFYDKSTYTGTHRHGGPTLLGGGVGDGDVVHVKELVNRDTVLEDALHRRKAGDDLPVLLGGSTESPSKDKERPTTLRARSHDRPERRPATRASPSDRRNQGRSSPSGSRTLASEEHSFEKSFESASPLRQQVVSPVRLGQPVGSTFSAPVRDPSLYQPMTFSQPHLQIKAVPVGPAVPTGTQVPYSTLLAGAPSYQQVRSVPAAFAAQPSQPPVSSAPVAAPARLTPWEAATMATRQAAAAAPVQYWAQVSR